MLLATDNCLAISRNSNNPAWDSDLFPAWAGLNAFYYITNQQSGQGVEPHYHDGDEFWLFLSGKGEGWLDGETFPIEANTLVYTPLGMVHRFQMFEPFAAATIATHLQGKQRAGHLLVEETGYPEKTGAGFVVNGSRNSGAIPQQSKRCLLSEFRAVSFAPGTACEELTLSVNEYWQVTTGILDLTVDGLEVQLTPGDTALLRTGAVRRLRCVETSQAVLARE